MAASAGKNRRGFTLVEVLVSLAIIFVVFIGLAETGLFALEQNILNTVRDEGTRIGETELSQVRSISFADVDAWDDPPNADFFVDVPVRGFTARYRVRRNVAVLDGNNRQVTVTVDWSRRGRNYSHQMTTIVGNRV